MTGRMIITSMALLALAACSAASGPTNTATGTTSESDLAQTEKAENAGTLVLHHGPESLLAAALHTLTLTPEQRATIEDALIHAARNAPVHPEKARLLAFATVVRTGEASANATDEQATVPSAAQREQLASSLGTLHAVLSLAQRRELVATLKKELAARAPSPSAATDDALRVPPHVRALLVNVDLSAEQKMLLTSAFQGTEMDEKEAALMRARFDAVREAQAARLDGFAAETFDAKSFVDPVVPPPGLPARDRIARDLAVAAKILTAAQREAVAQRVESGEIAMLAFASLP